MKDTHVSLLVAKNQHPIPLGLIAIEEYIFASYILYMIPFTGGREHSQPGGGGAGAKQGLLRPRGRRLEGRAAMLQPN